MDAATSELAELAVMSSLLDLEEFEVVHWGQDRAKRLRTFTVVPKLSVGLCPHCRRASDERHVCRDRTVLDLPMGGWRTELVVRLWQFRCRSCDRFFTPGFAALSEGAHATERLLDRLDELIAHGDVCAAARFFGVAEKTAERWYYQHLKRKQEQPQPALEPIRSLGIDELSLKKDAGNSVAS
jgi:transposase